jgi:hypothetical protein
VVGVNIVMLLARGCGMLAVQRALPRRLGVTRNG